MNIIKHENVLSFMLGGQARFVLWNNKTDNRFEYNVVVSKRCDTLWNIYSGVYLGSIYKSDSGLIQFKKSQDNVVNMSISAKAITWYLRQLTYKLEHIPKNIIVYHLGSCSVCGRELKDPVSIELGIGPVCLSRLSLLKA